MNKSEQVSSVTRRNVPRSDVQGRFYLSGGSTLLCDLSHDAFDVSYRPLNRRVPVKTLPFCKIHLQPVIISKITVPL